MSLLDDLELIRDAIHANCDRREQACHCQCGCDERIGCTCWALVCVQCHMNWLRERDPEPGRPACEPPSDVAKFREG